MTLLLIQAKPDPKKEPPFLAHLGNEGHHVEILDAGGPHLDHFDASAYEYLLVDVLPSEERRGLSIIQVIAGRYPQQHPPVIVYGELDLWRSYSDEATRSGTIGFVGRNLPVSQAHDELLVISRGAVHKLPYSAGGK